MRRNVDHNRVLTSNSFIVLVRNSFSLLFEITEMVNLTVGLDILNVFQHTLILRFHRALLRR